MGAFGAHVLRDRLDAYQMSVYEKAVFYHFIHALGILAVTLLARSRAIPAASLPLIAFLLFIGIVLFSGSLYVLALSGVRTLGIITPFGGVAFIAGWLVLTYELLRAPRL